MTTIASGSIIRGKGKDVHVIMNNIVDKEVARQLQHERWEHQKEVEALKREIEYRDRILREYYKINAEKMAEYTRPRKENFITRVEKCLAFVIGCIYVAASELCKFVRRLKK